MISFTQHNPRPCLLEDDLDALHALYPDCGHRPTEVVCHKTAHNIGFVRLGVYFLMPMMLSLLCAVVIGFITQRHQLRRLHSATRLIRQQSMQMRTAKRRESQAVEKADLALRAREEMQVQLAVAESSVQDRIEQEVVRAVQACTANDLEAPSYGASSGGGCSSAMDASRAPLHESRTQSFCRGTKARLSRALTLSRPYVGASMSGLLSGRTSGRLSKQPSCRQGSVISSSTTTQQQQPQPLPSRRTSSRQSSADSRKWTGAFGVLRGSSQQSSGSRLSAASNLLNNTNGGGTTATMENGGGRRRRCIALFEPREEPRQRSIR